MLRLFFELPEVRKTLADFATGNPDVGSRVRPSRANGPYTLLVSNSFSAAHPVIRSGTVPLTQLTNADAPWTIRDINRKEAA